MISRYNLSLTNSTQVATSVTRNKMGLYEIMTSFVLVGKNFKTNVFKIIKIDDGFDWWNRGFMVFITFLFGVAIIFYHWMFDVINCLDFQYPASGYEPTESMHNFHEFAQEYCWAYGLYTVREAYDLDPSQVPFPGIMPEEHTGCLELELVGGGRIECPHNSEMVPYQRLYLRWYPVIIFYFMFVFFLFFFPWRIYKLHGLKDIKDVVLMLQTRPEFADDLPFYIERGAVWLDKTLSVYIENRDTIKGKFKRHEYFFLIMLMKITYLIITIGVIFFTDRMLVSNHIHGGSYLTYGIQWLADITRQQPTVFTPIYNKLFPKMVQCEVKRWGVTGLEEWQGMCVLAGNVLYQWLFLGYWYCLAVSLILNTLSLFVICLSELRVEYSYRRFLNTAYVEDTKELKLIYQNIGTSGRIVLRIIANNVRPKVTDELIKYLIMFLFRKRDDQFPGRSDGYTPLKQNGNVQHSCS